MTQHGCRFPHKSNNCQGVGSCLLAGGVQVLLMYRCCTHEPWVIGITVPILQMRKLKFSDLSKLYDHQVSKPGFNLALIPNPMDFVLPRNHPQVSP